MFFSKTPTSVSEAIAPLRTVADNLAKVVNTKKAERSQAEMRLQEARKALERTEAAEGKVLKACDSETCEAEAILAKLNEFLGVSPTKKA